jgi:hypothetical protein
MPDLGAVPTLPSIVTKTIAGGDERATPDRLVLAVRPGDVLVLLGGATAILPDSVVVDLRAKAHPGLADALVAEAMDQRPDTRFGAAAVISIGD